MSESRDLRQQLRQSTAEAFRRAADAAPTRTGAPVPGDLCRLEACSEPGVEWLVLEIEDAAGECLVVPADVGEWIGSSDVALEDESVLGPLVLRCGLGLWLDRERLGGERRSGAVAAGDLERARLRRRQLLAGEVSATAAEREVDVDPDYRDWHRTLAAARDEIVRVWGGRVDEGPVSEIESGGEAEVPLAPVIPLAEAEKGRGERAVRRSRFTAPQLLAFAASFTGVLAAGFLVGRGLEERRGSSRFAELESAYSRLEDQLAQFREPEVAVPWRLAPLATRGGAPERLAVPAGARSIALLIDASQGDRIEIQDAAGEVLWSVTVEAPDTPDEDLIIWPAALTPPGDYEVFQRREGQVKLRFTLRIESP